MCYIVECIWEAFFHTMYQSKFLCGFYFHAVMTNWQTTLVYWFVFLFNVLCKNYLKQKLSTWKTPLKTNIEDDVRTHYCNDCLDLLIIKCETVWQIQTGPAQRHEWNTRCFRPMCHKGPSKSSENVVYLVDLGALLTHFWITRNAKQQRL